jgi:hypothetical protein
MLTQKKNNILQLYKKLIKFYPINRIKVNTTSFIKQILGLLPKNNITAKVTDPMPDQINQLINILSQDINTTKRQTSSRDSKKHMITLMKSI